jgi:hypothetical protein
VGSEAISEAELRRDVHQLRTPKAHNELPQKSRRFWMHDYEPQYQHLRACSDAVAQCERTKSNSRRAARKTERKPVGGSNRDDDSAGRDGLFHDWSSPTDQGRQL